MITIKNIDFLKTVFVAFMFAYINIFVGHSSTLLFFSSMILGSLFSFFFFSSAHSLAFSLLFIIDPFNISGLSIAVIIPFFLSFLILIFKTKYSLKVLKFDKNFNNLLKCLVLFSVYQLLISYVIYTPDLKYGLSEIKYWLGVWIVVPVYIIVYDQHKTFLGVIFLVVIINVLIYFLSIFGIFELNDVVKAGRYEGSSDALRLILYDLRQITKILVYLAPLYAVYHFRKKSSLVIIATGSFVFLAVLIAILRTEIFYLFMGIITSLYLGNKYLHKNNAFLKIAILGVFILIVFANLFPDLADIYNLVYDKTINVLKGESIDSSAQYRTNVQLPVIAEIISNNLIFGAGRFAVSYESSGHQLLYDLPVISAFGAYGLLGMSIYYIRFLFIFKRMKSIRRSKLLFKFYPNETLLVIALYSYFITMLLFRTLHLNIELAFETGQVELGLFMGVSFAMTRFLFEKLERFRHANQYLL